jgi:hypothetical protein
MLTTAGHSASPECSAISSNRKRRPIGTVAAICFVIAAILAICGVVTLVLVLLDR